MGGVIFVGGLRCDVCGEALLGDGAVDVFAYRKWHCFILFYLEKKAYFGYFEQYLILNIYSSFEQR